MAMGTPSASSSHKRSRPRSAAKPPAGVKPRGTKASRVASQPAAGEDGAASPQELAAERASAEHRAALEAQRRSMEEEQAAAMSSIEAQQAAHVRVINERSAEAAKEMEGAHQERMQAVMQVRFLGWRLEAADDGHARWHGGRSPKVGTSLSLCR